MGGRERSLRRTLTAFTGAVALLACLMGATLVVLTALTARASITMAEAVEDVRLLTEAERDLLLHNRARDPVVRRQMAGTLRDRLRRARAAASTWEKQRALEDAEALAEAYLEVAREPSARPEEVEARLEAAYEALGSAAGSNVAQAEVATRRVIRWGQRGTIVGVSIGALILALSIGLLWWLSARVFQPMLGLARSIERFAQGDRSARVEVAGPSELREMAQRFNQMASALAAQREAQMSFLGGVAHDLRNPLSVLKVAVASIRPDRALPPEPRARKMLEMISRQVVRLERMVTDLVDMAGIEAGKLDLKLERRDLRALIGEVVELFEGGGPRHRLLVSLPDQEVPVHCDPLRIEQVLGNLLSNAIKYSPEADQVEISLSVADGEALLSVTDHGLGIPEEERLHLFEPFRRIRLSSEGIPGVGLGLFVVRRIVEAHRGRIEVRSVLGVGSTFRVALPVARAEDATRAAPPEPPAAGH